MSPRRKPVEGSEDEAPPSVSPATAAALSGLPVSLVRAATNGAPEVRLRLERLGPKTRALETNTARAPIFALPTKGGIQLALEWEDLPVHGGTFTIRSSAGPLSPRDSALLAELHSRYVRDGCPDHRRVTVSAADLSRILGHRGVGGWQREIVADSMTRLRALTFRSTVRFVGEDGKPDSKTFVWGLVESAYLSIRGTGRGVVTLSEAVAALLRAGSVTFLHEPTWTRLLDRDEIAARLWTYLEADDLTRPRSYALWPAPPGEPARERSMPALADLLRLRDGNRRRVAARIRAACSVIADEDPRYRLEVVRSREPGMWRLEVRRGKAPAVGTSGYTEGAPTRDPDVRGEGISVYARKVSRRTLEGIPTYASGYVDVRGRAGNGGASSSLSSSSIVVEDVQDKTGDGARPRPLAELIGALDLGPRPDPTPAPGPVQSPSPEIAERWRARARAILETAATEAEREAARRYLEDE